MESKTCKELIELCREKGIRGYSGKKKADLIAMLTPADDVDDVDVNNNDNDLDSAGNFGDAGDDDAGGEADQPVRRSKAAKDRGNHLKPLFKWSGGKSDELDAILPHVPKDIDTYLEPFAGGASVFFRLNPEKAVVNDIHQEITKLYQAIKDGHSQDIYNFMQEHPNEETVYYEVRDKMPTPTDLDIAKRFYYERKTCFRGMSRYNKSGHFNICFGKYKTVNYQALLDTRYETLLKRTTILCGSFEPVFANYNNPANFMFLDPPYDSTFTDYGYCNFGKEEHVKLAECFKATKIRCLMVIGHTPFIEDLYKDFIVARYPKKYRFRIYDNRVTGEDIDNMHLVIKNY